MEAFCRELEKAMTKFSLVPQTVKVVKNEGSTARDHLANERTLLAWVRTAVALLALGLAIGETRTLGTRQLAEEEEKLRERMEWGGWRRTQSM